MTTSNSVDFDLTRNEIIKAALQKIEAIGQGETPNATQYTESSIALNALVKAWHGVGMPLWTQKQGYVLPVSAVSSCSLGPAGGHATLSYTRTQTSVAAVSGASTITVDSVTGISTGYYIGVELEDGTMHWTTVNGAPAGLVVTLTGVLTDDVAIDADVYVYQTKLQRPLRVTDAYIIGNTGAEYKINTVGRDTYFSLGNKDSEGIPNQIYYDSQIGNGVLHFYPRFADGNNVISFTFQRPLEDFDSSTDNPDFPQAWIRPLIFGLAYDLSWDYGMPKEDRKELFQTIYGPSGILELALNSDTEYGSVYFEVDDGAG